MCSLVKVCVLVCVVFLLQVYGGYLASLLLSSEDSLFKYNFKFKCGAAVSPITDFSLYGKSSPREIFDYFPLIALKVLCLLHHSGLAEIMGSIVTASFIPTVSWKTNNKSS